MPAAARGACGGRGGKSRGPGRRTTPRRAAKLARGCRQSAGPRRVVSDAEVTVQFIEPREFTDLSLSGSTTAGIQRHITDELMNYLKYLGDNYLPPKHQVDVTFLDIDMGGEYEPWRTPNLTHTRLVREAYVPRMDLRYVWRDGGGKVLADTRERVSDASSIAGFIYGRVDAMRFALSMLSSHRRAWVR
ncbi:MAG: DUF3016 domain-containing protein [Chromatiales bacterium]